MKRKITYVFFIISIVLGVYIVYKNIFLYRHTASICEDYDEVIEGYRKQEVLIVEKSTNNDFDYLEYKGMKIRNDFKDFKLEEKFSNLEDEADRYIREIDGKKSYAYFSYSDQLVTVFKSKNFDVMGYINVSLDDYKDAEAEEFLKRNNIKDDIDYLLFIKDNYYMKTTFLDSRREILDAYAFNLFTGIVIPKITSFTVIKGDYRGYILNNEKFREIHLLKDDKNYVIFLSGNDLISEEYIESLISSVII